MNICNLLIRFYMQTPYRNRNQNTYEYFDQSEKFVDLHVPQYGSTWLFGIIINLLFDRTLGAHNSQCNMHSLVPFYRIKMASTCSTLSFQYFSTICTRTRIAFRSDACFNRDLVLFHSLNWKGFLSAGKKKTKQNILRGKYYTTSRPTDRRLI